MKITQTIRLFMYVGLGCLIVFLSCKDRNNTSNSTEIADVRGINNVTEEIDKPLLDSSGMTVDSRFAPPKGYIRMEASSNSFSDYLRNFPLLDAGEKVHLYNGLLKNTQSVHAAVLDIDVGDKDLQQCADAVMRLRAEYLYENGRFEEIAFNFTNGWRFEYSKWREGNDLIVNGNRTGWKNSGAPKESRQEFKRYLDWVFLYAGTLSLAKELKPKKLEDIEVGDVFIYGGSPGHAVLVVDVAIQEKTGDKAFLLAQSYMPAQQIHILKNEGNDMISPWYLISEIESTLNTPEWTFGRTDLMEF